METKYSREEFIGAYKTFKVPKECVVVALKNVEYATKAEAEKLIKKFMEGKVK